MTLEDILTALTALIERERDSVWEQADLCAAAPPGSEGKLAETAGCSTSRIKGLARAARTFVGDRRYPDVPFSMFVLAASSQKALALFETAVADSWSVREYREAITGGSSKSERCPTCKRMFPRAAGAPL